MKTVTVQQKKKAMALKKKQKEIRIRQQKRVKGVGEERKITNEDNPFCGLINKKKEKKKSFRLQMESTTVHECWWL